LKGLLVDELNTKLRRRTTIRKAIYERQIKKTNSDVKIDEIQTIIETDAETSFGKTQVILIIIFVLIVNIFIKRMLKIRYYFL
jgi:hypothetical protein